MPPLITLLTDFGHQDVYVGVLKGVIAAICPTAQVIDLTHSIPPQDRYAARFNLLNALPHFPSGTIHLAVVDPGVGTTRRGVALQTQDSLLVGPDNGIFSGWLNLEPPLAAVQLTNPAYWRTLNPNPTFHGRDIFAPVAAYLARGLPLDQLGDAIPLQSLTQLDLPPLQYDQHQIIGTIQYIDHFGNGITTIPATVVADQSWQVELAERPLPTAATYGDLPIGSPLALLGSHGWVEVAVHQGSARQQLELQVGDEIVVRW